MPPGRIVASVLLSGEAIFLAGIGVIAADALGWEPQGLAVQVAAASAALAGALLEYETLSGDEIKRLIAGEDIGRDEGTPSTPLAAAGTSIPKTRRPRGPFGSPTPQGA